MAKLARWCFQHRWLVLGLWVAALVGLAALGRATGDDYKDTFSLPGTDSQKAIDILERDFPAQSGDSATVVLHARTGTLTDPAIKAQVTDMVGQLAKLPHVAEVISPFSADGKGQINEAGTTAFATIALDLPGNELQISDIEHVVDTARGYDKGALQVEATGQVVANTEQTTSSTELIGIIAAAIILFVAFGSLLAVTLPLITALAALGVGLSLIIQVSHLTSVAEFSTMLATLIGLGVGIDYALFIVNRHRIGLRAGRSPEEAAVNAVNTSGRAVLFAGATVCIALLGLFALGVTFLYGVALAAALTVAMTMLSSVTLLPALLGFYGQKVLSRRERRRIADHGPEPEAPSGFWWRWAKGVERRPAVLAVLSAVAIAVIAIPFFSLRLGSSDLGNGSEDKTTKRGYDLLAEGFGPGFNGPFSLITDLSSGAGLQALNQAVAAARDTPGVASVTEPRQSPNGRAAIATLYPTSSPQSPETAELLDRLRDDVIPTATAGAAAPVYVGGITAIFEDFAGVLSDKLPLFIGIVVVLAFILLVVVFRSLLIPLTASVMNLLAVGAAFGAVVAVFQWGWLSDLFGLSPGPIEAFLPVMLFAILFGLSMDYEVFLVSRMHEEWTARRDNRIAVSLGQAETGRVISAAGAIMTLVFAAFILGDERVIKLFGLGLALAIAIDAFVIRTILVPALMHLFGRANWWLPRGLDRVLPRVSVETSDDLAEAHQVPVPAGDFRDGVPAQPHEPAESERTH
ncbi:putative drug exporter of the RND superfamily [Parafrankia irregularis]|uniref:Putative drug exporter of the RND superfamily n=1 Tax=Parafrankia irregularis TaxID=795642 RepID=A0A0S4QQM2_9ACTN|nr:MULTISPECIES: MMPL family transporter [Parafrankia]MBE3202737.1 MMPL family transporter [Parafrankia sp. CH37]CUU57925.1 putative drug exporter of the RND superfamily [Parafrankia irregularis]